MIIKKIMKDFLKRKIILTILVFLFTFVGVSYGISFYLKSIKFVLELNKTLDLEWKNVNESEIEYENLTVYMIDIESCNSNNFCTIDQNINSSKTLLIFKLHIKNLEEISKTLNISFYRTQTENRFYYFVGYKQEGCRTEFNNGYVNLCSLNSSNEYNNVFTINLNPLEEKEYYIGIYIPEILKEGNVNITVSIIK